MINNWTLFIYVEHCFVLEVIVISNQLTSFEASLIPVNFLSSHVSLFDLEIKFFNVSGVYYINFATVIKNIVVVIAIVTIVTILLVKPILANYLDYWNHHSY